jgi:starch phosphorylase
MKSHLETFQVFPAIPAPLEFLETLSRNLWWSWHRDAVELFRRIDPQLWECADRNPIAFLNLVSQGRLEKVTANEGFLSHLERVQERFRQEIETPLSADGSSTAEPQELIAYFSMEFGIHENLPIYSGGLGVLAGDHLKAASDMGLPMIGIGLFYQYGYFHQFLDHNGWQQESYPETDIFHLPLSRAKDAKGQDLVVSLEGPEGVIQAVVWQINVGRIPLILLDTSITANPPEVRAITSRLYPGESKLRLAQEVLLGIGGMRALAAMGRYPTVTHMNEGHCAFLGLERLVQARQRHGVSLAEAKEIVGHSNVFTTHTPVAAGHDEFPFEMVKPYLRSFEAPLEAPLDEILAWGQSVSLEKNGTLSMFVLGLRLSQYCNGVSELHGKVARRMWSHVWPDRPEEEVPIAHVTNGVHIPSWISIENSALFERYLGPDWYLHLNEPEVIQRIEGIYDEELWRAHEMSRSRLIRFSRTLMTRQYGRRNAPRALMEQAESVLDPDCLTIGFARRFATYKRAHLLLSDPDRLEAMIASEDRPVQIIFAGKAHPKDNEGKGLVKQLIEFARRPAVRQRVIFLEDYDINIARYLVQGADVWLNTPRRPFEACGTSGIKAAVNGVLNLSVLDGWWCEGYSKERGWRIGNGEEYSDAAYQDALDSQALYNILENDVIPCFYERKNGNPPVRWLAMMRASMQMGLLNFSAQKMMRTYHQRYYAPSTRQYHQLTADGTAAAAQLVAQRQRLNAHWPQVQLTTPARVEEGPFRVGQPVELSCEVHLGELTPEEVDVEVYFGSLKTLDTLADGQVEPMQATEDRGGGDYRYTATLSCTVSGRYGYTTRVLPRGDYWIRNTPGLLTWASGNSRKRG